MSRQYAHLSATPEIARQVGSRRDKKPVILIIRAREAQDAGIKFGKPSGETEEVWLVKQIPPAFIEFAHNEA